MDALREGIASSISEIFRQGRAHWPGGLSQEQYSVLNLIAHCRTGVLGELDHHCNHCGYTKAVPQSCGNRHCPTCLGPRQAHWSAKVCRRLPPISHFHVVFTVPPQVSQLMHSNKRVLLGLLFRVVAKTLKGFMKQNWRGHGGFLAVLHTWGQTLQWHPHLHVLVSAGRVAHQSGRWKQVRPSYLFPVKSLSKVYRAIFLRGLEGLEDDDEFKWPARLASRSSRARWRRDLARKTWHLRSKPTENHTRAVVRYLARYTSRVAISNRRIRQFHAQRATVRFSYRDRRRNHQQRELSLTITQFTRRFAQHILPRSFQRIRYYGFLNSTDANCRHPGLPRSDASLEKPFRPKPCPRCGATNWTHLYRAVSLANRACAPSSSSLRTSNCPSATNSLSLLSARPPPSRSNKRLEPRPDTPTLGSEIESGPAQL